MNAQVVEMPVPGGEWDLPSYIYSTTLESQGMLRLKRNFVARWKNKSSGCPIITTAIHVGQPHPVPGPRLSSDI